MRVIVAMLMLAMTVSCVRASYYDMDTWAKAYEPSAAQTAASDDDIRESVFRYLIANNRSEQGVKVHAYYLAVEGGADPTGEFLARFSRGATPVKKLSDCNATAQKPLGVVDKQTGLPGLVLRVDTIKRSGDAAAEVTGGYFEGGDTGPAGVYQLEFKNGRWAVSE